MSYSAIEESPRPLGEMNTTPLIDVLLVLLVMFIITIPIASHSVDIDLPSEGPVTPLTPDLVRNKLVLQTDGGLMWNGTPTDRHQLAATLEQTLLLPVEPELQFEPEAQASYELSAKVLNIIKASGVSNFGFVGNSQYRQFESAK